ncbi:MAG: response regulator [Sedimentisphaerales bacterium]|nr:response regulator [Sedimentisphaerales bacterium]
MPDDSQRQTKTNNRAAKSDRVTKKVFSTGDAAAICKISQQTIIRCFDSGRLEGFRVPGSRFRRIPRDSLIKFMRENDIPLDLLEETNRSKVLVVDDDPEIVELIVDVLERDGRFEVRTASSGYDAGVITQEFRPDVMILDYMLPDVNGNVVCRTIRQNPTFGHMKIIIVSGVINQDEIDALLKQGADAYLKKPFSIDDLVNKMAELLTLG